MSLPLQFIPFWLCVSFRCRTIRAPKYLFLLPMRNDFGETDVLPSVNSSCSSIAQLAKGNVYARVITVTLTGRTWIFLEVYGTNLSIDSYNNINSESTNIGKHVPSLSITHPANCQTVKSATLQFSAEWNENREQHKRAGQ